MNDKFLELGPEVGFPFVRSAELRAEGDDGGLGLVEVVATLLDLGDEVRYALRLLLERKDAAVDGRELQEHAGVVGRIACQRRAETRRHGPR